MSNTITTRPNQTPRSTQAEATLRDLAYVYHLTAKVKQTLLRERDLATTGYTFTESAE